MRNLKKVIALVAVFAMMVSTVAFAGAFSDVAATDNYAEAIETLNALGIITGDDEDGDGVMDFRPADTITRAEVTAIVARIQGMNAAAQTNTVFNDVPATHWASGYVSQAANQGIVNGYGDGNFGPEDNVKYQEMVKMLMETLGYRPFANDNGGYPTGYLAAAQRYGVLDGVIGGAIDVEASRGMVAQMVYNAIDTPLMDQVTYGTEGEYAILDGTGYYGFSTLLARDLKMIKFTGKVAANSYSGGYDAEADRTIEVDYVYTDGGYNYLGDGMFDSDDALLEDVVFLQGDVDCDPYLGLTVEIYAKRYDSRDPYTVVAINGVTSTKNTASFTLDQYAGVEGDYVKYLKNETDRNASKLKIQSNATVIYNNANVNVDAIGDVFGALVVEDGVYSGLVTLLDTDTTNGYDVIDIEIGVGAVVDEITKSGDLKFKKNLTFPYFDTDNSNAVETEAVRTIDLSEEATTTYVTVTKDGDAFDVAELVEWDVVTVVWNPVAEVYEIRVLGEDNYVDGYISSVSVSDDKVTLTDGNKYGIAAQVDGMTSTISSSLVGLAGRFFVDEYGMIVALDKTVEVEGAGSGAAGNYAYIIEAATSMDTWNNEAITVQALAKDGEVYEADLASTVKLINFDTVLSGTFAGKTVSDNMSVKVEDIADADAFADILEGQLITYAANNSGEIKSIVLPGDDEDDELYGLGGSASAVYREDTNAFKGTNIMINDETIVFYISNSQNDVDNYAVAKEYCSVATGASVVDDSYYVAGFDPDYNDEAQVIVIFNTQGGFSAEANVAIIDSKSTTIVNGTDEVTIVDYYINGELMTATTDVDLTDAAADVIADANRGDIVKLVVTGDVITNATAIMNFDEADIVGGYNTTLDLTYEAGVNVNGGVGTDDQEYFFGAVVKASNSGNLYLRLLDEDGSVVVDDNSDPIDEIIKEGDANVYIYDASITRETRRLSVGSLGDADYDDELLTKTAILKKATDDKAVDATVSAPAYGMMDYIFARYYNNRPADIVIIKNYDFKYSTVDVEA